MKFGTDVINFIITNNYQNNMIFNLNGRNRVKPVLYNIACEI